MKLLWSITEEDLDLHEYVWDYEGRYYVAQFWDQRETIRLRLVCLLLPGPYTTHEAFREGWHAMVRNINKEGDSWFIEIRDAVGLASEAQYVACPEALFAEAIL